jgi:hypothetical protein
MGAVQTTNLAGRRQEQTWRVYAVERLRVCVCAPYACSRSSRRFGMAPSLAKLSTARWVGGILFEEERSTVIIPTVLLPQDHPHAIRQDFVQELGFEFETRHE